ncbi:DUF7800 domain-containing protein [Fibrisoma montanum]|uniref:DUF7800 domain-containing protein n=1 Tax=Fibrisoma montanum TaxID=2305895 RepID=UPI001E312B26|nr:hypothetical protein [Fibrisoma montanum]
MYKISRVLLLLIWGSAGPAIAQVPPKAASATNATPRTIQSGTVRSETIQSGPMVGYSDMREVMLWVQTRQPARVQIRYYEPGNPTQARLTNEVRTEAKTAFTAHLLADQVEPGKKYVYDVLIEGRKASLPYPTRFQTQNLWQCRTDQLPAVG